MNALTSEQLDFIVREVVRRLKNHGMQNAVRGDVSPNAHELASASVERVASDSRSTIGRLVVSERVVTVATLQRRLSGISEVVVPRKAVVTPAVIDLLKERSIRWHRRTSDADEPKKKTLVLAKTGSQFETPNIENCLLAHGYTMQPMVRSDVEGLVKVLEQQVQEDGTVAVVITDRPYQFSCIANRSSNVRAVVGCHEQVAREATHDANANLMVVKAGVGTQQIIEAFLTAV